MLEGRIEQKESKWQEELRAKEVIIQELKMQYSSEL